MPGITFKCRHAPTYSVICDAPHSESAGRVTVGFPPVGKVSRNTNQGPFAAPQSSSGSVSYSAMGQGKEPGLRYLSPDCSLPSLKASSTNPPNRAPAIVTILVDATGFLHTVGALLEARSEIDRAPRRAPVGSGRSRGQSGAFVDRREAQRSEPWGRQMPRLPANRQRRSCTSVSSLLRASSSGSTFCCLEPRRRTATERFSISR